MLGEELVDGSFEVWEFMLNDVPDNFGVDAKVLMDQDVSESRDLCPLNIRCAGTNIFGDLFRRFTDNLEIPYDRVECFIVLKERCLRKIVCVYPYLAGGVPDVFEINPLIPWHRRFHAG